jgi:hypothetical protein
MASTNLWVVSAMKEGSRELPISHASELQLLNRQPPFSPPPPGCVVPVMLLRWAVIIFWFDPNLFMHRDKLVQKKRPYWGDFKTQEPFLVALISITRTFFAEPSMGHTGQNHLPFSPYIVY